MDEQRLRTACFTGHRIILEPIDVVRKKVMEVLEQLIKVGYLYFAAGGARGFDTLAAESVLRLKKRYPEIHLILVLPFDCQYEYERGWKQKEIGQYFQMKAEASKVIVMSDGYSQGIYHRRNRHLVDCSSICIAYMVRKNSGTGYTVDYAHSQGVQVIHIAAEKRVPRYI